MYRPQLIPMLNSKEFFLQFFLSFEYNFILKWFYEWWVVARSVLEIHWLISMLVLRRILNINWSILFSLQLSYLTSLTQGRKCSLQFSLFFFHLGHFRGKNFSLYGRLHKWGIYVAIGFKIDFPGNFIIEASYKVELW